MRYTKYCITYIHHDIDKYSLCQGQITITLVFFSPKYSYYNVFSSRFLSWNLHSLFVKQQM